MLIYFIKTGAVVKIGVTKNIEGRIANLQTANHLPLELLHTIEIEEDKVYETEKELHYHFRHTRLSGEWFVFTPFMKEVIEYIEINGYSKNTEAYITFKGRTEAFCNLENLYTEIENKAREYMIKGDFHAVEGIIEQMQESIQTIKDNLRHKLHQYNKAVIL